MRYGFGDLTLDTDTLELRRGDSGEIEVEPQVFAVLQHLVDERHRVVTKEELLDAVWGDRFVSESALTTRIKQARQAVGDTGARQDVIRTFHGRGYRFVADVTVEPAAPPAAPPDVAGPPVQTRVPRTHYAESGGASIAYQTFGTGPDLVLIAGFATNVEVQWEHPMIREFLQRLGSFARVTVLDKRGVGLSDRMGHDDAPPLEVRADDLHAVMDAASIERATVLGSSEGGSLAALFAATHPERVERLILHNTWVVGSEVIRPGSGDLEVVGTHWGKGVVYAHLGPSLASDRAGKEFAARYERQSASPRAARHLLELSSWLDISGALPAIAVPTVVLHRRDDPVVPLEHGHTLARTIPNARLIELAGSDHYLFAGDADETLDAIERVHTGTRVARSPVSRVLATVLFVDIVGSTERTRDLGDEQWASMLDQFDVCTADVVGRHQGTVVKSTGDGVLATFDAPGRAVQAALALNDAVAEIGLSVRAGLHTSEIQQRGADITGIGVNLASRVTDAAPGGEVWVTRTVTDLVAGTGLDFEERGSHDLKGIDRPWELYAVRR